MTDIDSERCRLIIVGALELPRDARRRFAEQECGEDTALLEEVLSLLSFADTKSEFLCPEAPPDSSQDMSFPERIGQYRIVRKIGEGGMGVVYEAEQDSPKRRVALKVLRSPFVGDAMRQRFEYEATVLGRLHHEGIAHIYEAGAFDLGHGQQPFFAMELLDGRPLSDIIRSRELDVRASVVLMMRVCEAAHHAHQQGVIHRDLKPENIMIDGDGRPKILDFGIARGPEDDANRRTVPGMLVGTLDYMSPEQLEATGDHLTKSADIYALGVILFELMTGELPHELHGMNLAEVAATIAETDAPRLGSKDTSFRSSDLDLIVGKALEKDPAQRYPSAASLASDLARFLDHLPVFARAPSTFYQMRKFARRHRGLVGGLVIAGIVLVAGVTVSLLLMVEARDAARRANRKAYRASLTAAAGALDRQDAPDVLRHLVQAPAEYRGWEWQHYRARSDAVIAKFVQNAEAASSKSAKYEGRYVAWSASGRALGVFGWNRGLRVVDVMSGTELRSIETPTHPMYVTMSADGTHVAAQTTDENRLSVWSVATGDLVYRSPPLPALPPRRVLGCLSSNGALVAYAELSGLSVASVANGEIRFSFVTKRDPKTGPSSCVFSPDGRTLFAQFEDNAYVLDSATGAVRSRIATNRRDGAKHVQTKTTAAVFAPQGGEIAGVAGQREFLVMDLTTREFVAAGPESDGGHEVAYVAGTSQLAISHGNGVRFFDRRDWGVPAGPLVLASLQSRRRERYVRVLATTHASSLAFSPDARRVVVGDSAGFEILDLEHQSVIQLRDDGYVNFVSWSPDGTMLATSGFGSSVNLWDATSGDRLASMSASEKYFGLGFSRDGARVLAASRDRVTSWDTATGEPESVPIRSGESSWLVLQSHTGAHTASRSGNLVGVTAQKSRDGSLLLAADLEGDGNKGELVIYDGNSLRERARILARPGHRSALDPESRSDSSAFADNIRAVALSADLRRAASYAQGRLHLTDVRSGELLCEAPATLMYGLDFSPDGTRLACGLRNGRIEIRDAHTLELLVVLSGHRYYVFCVAFSPDGTRLASASGDGTARIWDSVPARVRFDEKRRLAILRAEMIPRVEALRRELGDRARTADALRTDPAIDADRRRVALRLLLAEHR